MGRVVTNVSLCEQCVHYDTKYSDVSRKACEEAKIECHCVWCAATDQPDPERWDACINFKEYDDE